MPGFYKPKPLVRDWMLEILAVGFELLVSCSVASVFLQDSFRDLPLPNMRREKHWHVIAPLWTCQWLC